LVTSDEDVITSTANPRIKELVRLNRRSEREATGRFLIEGARELRRAISSGVEVEQVLLCDELAGAEESAAASMVATDRILRVAAEPYGRVSRRRHPDGILGIAARLPTDLARFEPGSNPIVLIADGLEKPGNIGAILRSADAAGAALLTADAATDLFNPNVVRASQGSLFTVPIAVAAGPEALAWSHERLRIFVATAEASLPYWAADMTGPVGLVVGSEHRGVSAGWRDAGEPVSIPMAGAADSLNTSVTAALLLYEAVRQRRPSAD
jgi:TrmH family RNA methyltransferase